MLTAQRPAIQLDPWTLPFHPIASASYFVLFLFAQNLEQQLTLAPLWTPLALAVAGAAVLFGVALLAFREPIRAGLFTTLVIVLFFTFGHAWILVRDALGHRSYLLGAYIVIGLLLAWLIWRGGAWTRGITRVLNVGFGLLVAVNIVSIASFVLDDPPPTAAAAATPMIEAPVEEPAAEPPDIYYIILDRYANAGTLESVYGHDNGPFLDELRARGFFVAEEAWANYFKTAFSLASSLDMQFLPGPELAAEAEPDLEMRPIHTMLSGPLTGPATLRALGYEYVHVGSWFVPTATNAIADVTMNYSDDLEFRTALSETTLLSMLSPPRSDGDGTSISNPSVARAYHEYGMVQLEMSAERDGPTFTFAHFLLPHPPYVYEADGSIPDPDVEKTDEARYIAQLQYTNDRVLQAIDGIVARSADRDPVIILQADEGPFPTAYARNEATFNWLEATPEQIAHKFGILYAARMPGVDAEEAGLHARSTPVNALRIVLNAYLDADLPLLPDSLYLSPDHHRPYDFVEIERGTDGMPLRP